MKLRWTRTALNDLAEIQDYIARENPTAARMVGRTIRASTDRLADHPYCGRPGPVEGTHELVVAKLPYVIAYRVAGAVEILAIRHDAQLWPEKAG
jgi:addiction module RelE/StbE family toxin